MCVPEKYYLSNFTYDPDDMQSVAISNHIFGTVKNLSFLGLSVSIINNTNLMIEYFLAFIHNSLKNSGHLHNVLFILGLF